MTTSDEQRGYSRGYAAGRRRVQRQDYGEEYRRLKELFIQQMMISIAPELLRNPWGKKIDGVHKPFTLASDIAQNVRSVADELAAQCTFIPAPVAFTDDTAIEARGITAAPKSGEKGE